MRKFLQFIGTPLIGVGWVWFFVRSAFNTGQDLSREFLYEVFEEDAD